MEGTCRYQVSLPWKELHVHDPLPDNYQLSIIRLRGLLHRLKQDPVIMKEYDHVIQDQLEKGIVEAVPADESVPRTTHYLPHHAVNVEISVPQRYVWCMMLRLRVPRAHL